MTGLLEMTSKSMWRRLVAAALLAIAEIAAIGTISVALSGGAQAQFFDDRFPMWGGRRQRPYARQKQAETYKQRMNGNDD